MRAVIFTTDHKVILKKIRSGREILNHKGKLYEVDPRAVVSAFYEGKPKKAEPRLFYFESEPGPIYYTGEGKRPDTSFNLMEKEIRLNAIDQQSSPSLGSKLGPIVERLGSWLSIYNVFILIVVASLVWAYLEGALGL